MAADRGPELNHLLALLLWQGLKLVRPGSTGLLRVTRLVGVSTAMHPALVHDLAAP